MTPIGADDLLLGAQWECCCTAPGEVEEPAGLGARALEWWPVRVPGTAAGAFADAGLRLESLGRADDFDWWFRCGFDAPSGGPWRVELGGLATVADVWMNGRHLAHSENMFVSWFLDLATLEDTNELAIRFRALTPLLEMRRPRPRFKSMMVDHQSLRWFRTTVLGRQPGWAATPAPVGPWRPVRVVSAETPRLVSRRVKATCTGADGVVEVELALAGMEAPRGRKSVTLHVGEASAVLESTEDGALVRFRGSVTVRGVRRWWPHTHGAPYLYPMGLEVSERRVDLGRIGFRSIALDRADDGFGFVVNDHPVFCRGACWWPLDPVALSCSDEELRRSLELVRDANMNMVRIPGGTVYEDERFWDLCDELGLLVWQDCMLGYTDPPEDEDFERSVSEELEEVLGRLGGRPSLAVVCGGQEIEEQAAFFGLTEERRRFPLITKTIPALVEDLLPGIPYVSSSPTGGALAFQPDSGDCHYWGVGSLLRSFEDARLSGIRFMSEGLAFANPPERQTIDQVFGGPSSAGHDPAWKSAVHHDTGRPFDLDDVRDHYVGQLMRVDPQMLRYLDPERGLDLGRAVVAELMSKVLGEWRRAGSSCSGGLVVAFRDLVAGGGWGVVDALGRPKSPWFALKRVLAPLAVLVSDEGLNGLHLHLVNDTPDEYAGNVRLELFGRGELLLEAVDRRALVDARSSVMVEASSMLDGFRDISYAYRYGPQEYDAVRASLVRDDDTIAAETVFLPGGLDRSREPEVGLAARISATNDPMVWTLAVSTRRLAQWVVVEVPGYLPDDSWFHLPPGRTRTLTLRRTEETAPPTPKGQVRSLNSYAPAPVATG